MGKQPGPVKQARRIVGAQYAPVDYQAQKARQRSAAERASLDASRTALVKLLQGGVAPAGQAYDAAVGQQQALAQGAADLLAQANPNAQIQADLASVNAPPEQQASLARSLQAQFPGQGAVLNVQEGAIPGASLIAQKAAEQGYLAGLPTVAALSGEQSLRGLLAKEADQQQAFQAERLRIGGQFPALVDQLAERAYTHQQDAQDRAFQQRQFAYQQRNDALDRAAAAATTDYQRAQIALERKRLNAEIQSNQPTGLDYYKAQTDRINADRARKEALAGGGSGASWQYKHNADGSIDLFNPKTHKIVRVQGPGGGKGSEGMSQTAVRAARANAYGIVNRVKKNHANAGAKDKDGNPIPRATYDDAVEQALEENVPLWIAVPMLNKVFPAQYKLTSHGLVQTGIRGQPSWGKPRKKKR